MLQRPCINSCVCVCVCNQYTTVFANRIDNRYWYSFSIWNTQKISILFYISSIPQRNIWKPKYLRNAQWIPPRIYINHVACTLHTHTHTPIKLHVYIRCLHRACTLKRNVYYKDDIIIKIKSPPKNFLPPPFRGVHRWQVRGKEGGGDARIWHQHPSK